MWFTYNTIHQFWVYSSVSSDKCVHLCKHYLNQDVKYFHHLNNYFGASSHQSTSHPQTQETIDLLSLGPDFIQYMVLLLDNVRFILSHASEVRYLLMSIFFVWTTTVCSFSCCWTFGLFSGFFWLIWISAKEVNIHAHMFVGTVFSFLLGECTWRVTCLKEAFRLFQWLYCLTLLPAVCVVSVSSAHLELSVVGGGISLWFKSPILSWWMMLSLFPSTYLLLWCIFSSVLRAFFCF